MCYVMAYKAANNAALYTNEHIYSVTLDFERNEFEINQTHHY